MEEVFVPGSSDRWDVGFALDTTLLRTSRQTRAHRRSPVMMELGDLSFGRDPVLQCSGGLGSRRGWFQAGSFGTRTTGGFVAVGTDWQRVLQGTSQALLPAGVISNSRQASLFTGGTCLGGT